MHELDADRPSLRRRLVVASLTVALAAGLTPGLAQADPISLGAGQQPDVAIDSSGTAYIAWNSTDGNTLYFCRLPESASSCSPTTLPVSDSASARPAVFVNGSTVQVMTNRCCSSGSKTELFTSGDGGVTFGSPVVIGNLNPSGDAAYGPGNGISIVTSALINSYYQLAPTDGSTAASAQVPLSSQYTYHGSVAIVSGKPVVVFDDLNGIAYTTTNGGDPNQAASWTTPTVAIAGHDPHLVNGPAGLYMIYTNDQGNLDEDTYQPGSGWGRTIVLPYAPTNVDAAAQGPAGTLSLVWKQGNGNPTSLEYSGYSSARDQWSTALTIATDSQIANLRLADGGDGAGVAVWDNGSQVSVARHPLPPTPPQAAFTVTPSGRLCPGQKVYFDASGSTPGSAPITSYHWELSNPYLRGLDADGVPAASVKRVNDTTSPTDVYTYHYGYLFGTGFDVQYGLPNAEAIFGTSVRLTVRDANGLTSEAQHQLSFYYDPVDLSAPPSSAPPPPCYTQPILTGPPQFPPSLHLIRSSIVEVPVTCRRAALCGGLVALRTFIGARGIVARVAASTGGRRGAVVGQVRFALTRGHRATIKIKLNKRGKALARRGQLRRLWVTVTTLHLGRGRGKTVSRVLTVKRSRR